MTTGKITHANVGKGLDKPEFEAEDLHEIGGIPGNVVRTATKVIAASDADATFKVETDITCSDTNDDDEVQIRAVLDGIS